MSDFIEVSREDAIEMALRMYCNEPCRICGELLTREAINDAVFAGYSIDNKSRAAHGSCWRDNIPKKQWAYPVDAK